MQTFNIPNSEKRSLPILLTHVQHRVLKLGSLEHFDGSTHPQSSIQGKSCNDIGTCTADSGAVDTNKQVVHWLPA